MVKADNSRGFFGHGDMQKEFEEAAFALNKGEVSGMVDTASGLHLIQRLGTQYESWFHADRVHNRLE